MIRQAGGSDAETLLQIYAQYIDTPVTFEYTLPTVPQFQGRINRIASEYPYLIWQEEGQVLGYAYAHRHQERAAYQWNAETSVYLDRAHCGRGIGTRLYAALLELLKMQGVRTAYACVTLPNAASEHLHRSFGFADLGVQPQAGYKCGRWHDVIWYGLSLLPHRDGEEPLPPCGIHDLAPSAVRAVLEDASLLQSGT